MRAQNIIAEHVIYILLYLFIVLGFIAILHNLEKTYLSFLSNKNIIIHLYTKEKLLDLIPESEIVSIRLGYPLESSLKHPYSNVIKNGSVIIVLSR